MSHFFIPKMLQDIIPPPPEKKSVTETPKVAVVVPVYNVERYLKECLDSLLAQTYKNFTIFAVDDESIDSSGRILDEYGSKDPRNGIHRKNRIRFDFRF